MLRPSHPHLSILSATLSVHHFIHHLPVAHPQPAQPQAGGNSIDGEAQQRTCLLRDYGASHVVYICLHAMERDRRRLKFRHTLHKEDRYL